MCPLRYGFIDHLGLNGLHKIGGLTSAVFLEKELAQNHGGVSSSVYDPDLATAPFVNHWAMVEKCPGPIDSRYFPMLSDDALSRVNPMSHCHGIFDSQRVLFL